MNILFSTNWSHLPCTGPVCPAPGYLLCPLLFGLTALPWKSCAFFGKKLLLLCMGEETDLLRLSNPCSKKKKENQCHFGGNSFRKAIIWAFKALPVSSVRRTGIPGAMGFFLSLFLPVVFSSITFRGLWQTDRQTDTGLAFGPHSEPSAWVTASSPAAPGWWRPLS